MRIVIIAVIIVVLGLAGYLGFNTWRISGGFGPLEERLVEECTAVETFPGPEDVTIDPASGLAYIAASDRRSYWNDAEEVRQGGIYALDLDDPSSLRLISTDAPDDFQPHGFDLWTDENGASRLFVISHPRDHRQVVEIFDVTAPGVLRHAETIEFPEMWAPNDLAAVGPRQFYVSNDHGWPDGFGRTLEDYLALPISNVAYFDGENGTIVAGGLRYANGVRASADGATIYVADLFGRAVRIYERNADTGALDQVRRIALSTNPDNIELGSDNDLIIGAHPRPFAFLAHVRDENETAPSEIVRVDLTTGASETVFMATQGQINAAAAGAVDRGRLLIGAVLDPRVMICPFED